MNTFNTGDIVMLKSGGPRMTVEGPSGTSLVCSWFDHKTKNLKRETFLEDTLKKIDTAGGRAGRATISGIY